MSKRIVTDRIRLQLARQALQMLTSGNSLARRELFPGDSFEVKGQWQVQFLNRLISSGLIERQGASNGVPTYIARDPSTLEDLDASAFLWPGAGSSDAESEAVETEEELEGLDQEAMRAELEAASPQEDAPQEEADGSRDERLVFVFTKKLDEVITVLESMNDRLSRLEKKGAAAGRGSGAADDLVLEVASKVETRLETLSKAISFFDADQLSEVIATAVATAVSEIQKKPAADITATLERLDHRIEEISQPIDYKQLRTIISADIIQAIQKRMDDMEARIPAGDVGESTKKLEETLAHFNLIIRAMSDALGEYRKSDEGFRSKLLESTTQTMNVSVKAIKDEITNGRLSNKIDKKYELIEEKIRGLDTKMGALRSDDLQLIMDALQHVIKLLKSEESTAINRRAPLSSLPSILVSAGLDNKGSK